jgi:tRNA pseudouridine38-40 synthase
MTQQKNIKLILAYDGTHYQGWQRGSEGKSIEETLEKTLSLICQHPVVLQAASRTDAGVHAEGQVVNFFSTKELAPSQLSWSLNQLLPKDLAVIQVEFANDSFHPTLDSISKEYRYYICNSPHQLPHHRLYSWHVYQRLNFDSIDAGMQLLQGKHDFSSFCNHHINQNYVDHIREIFSFERIALPDKRHCFIVRGNHFLYRMVRNLVGTLIDIGRGKIALEELSHILKARDRTCAGVSAPAHGLFLHQISYKNIQ